MKHICMKKNVCWILIGIMLPILSCTKSGDTIYVDDDLTEDTRPIVYFIYKEGSLGDMGYMDALYRGIAKAANDGNMLLSLAELPSDTSKIDFALSYFLNYMEKVGANRKSIIVIANDNLESMLHHYEGMLKESGNVSVLLAETQDTTLAVHSIRFPVYGACYQAGRITAQSLSDVSNILVVTANPNENSLADMGKAFTLGIEEGKVQANREVDIANYYISNTTGGYDEAEQLYQMSYDIDQKYQLVVPVCGGTVQGLLRYNREHPNSFYTVGMDTDLQQYSSKVPFSIVKHIDKAMEDWITKWAKGEQLEKHLSLGLSSGYTELVIADQYSDELGDIAKQIYPTAIEKEKEYESKKP